MQVNINLNPDTGKYELEDSNQAKFLFDAILASFPEEELMKMERCPMCDKKTVFKMHHYEPTKRMIKILFEMRRVLVADPDQHEFVYMREEADTIKDSQALYSMVQGSQQNHKMCYLGLITQIDKKGNPVPPGSTGTMRAAYKITEKGMKLLKGESISPWRIHRRLGRTIITDEDKQTSGTILDAKDMSYDDYVNMCKNAEVDYLKLPEVVNAEAAK